jgi:hypothetical protein
MANDFAGVAEQSYRAFVERAGTFRGWWDGIVGVDMSQKPTLNEGGLFGLDYYDSKTVTGSATAIDLDSATASTSIAQFEKKLVFMRADWEYDAPGVMQATAELATVGWATVDQTIADGFSSLGSTTHGFNGESWLDDGAAGTCYMVDSYRIDPANATIFSQANLQTTAFSDTALSSSLALHGNYKNFSGLPLVNAGSVAPYLVTTAALETVARADVDREREISHGNNSGTSVVDHAFGARLAGYRKMQGATTVDPNDWYLVFVRDRQFVDMNGGTVTMNSGPIRLWLRTPPEVLVSKVDGQNDMQAVAYLEHALIYDHNILFDMIKHEVS